MVEPSVKCPCINKEFTGEFINTDPTVDTDERNCCKTMYISSIAIGDEPCGVVSQTPLTKSDQDFLLTLCSELDGFAVDLSSRKVSRDDVYQLPSVAETIAI